MGKDYRNKRIMEKRECNVCGQIKKPHKFKHDGKKTCLKCETRWWRKFLRLLVKERRLSPQERIGNRLGYMGSAFIMSSPYLLPYDNIGAYTYLIGALLSLPQVWLAKQWNLVVINLNLLVGYGLYLFN
jgi:hypothetical protein